MLNWIWMALIVIGVVVGALMGTLGGEDGVVESAYSLAKFAVVNIAIPLSAIMMMWLGIMRLGEKAGLIAVLARVIRPVMVRLFPDVPGDHPAMGAMIMNMAANMLGLGNAATPLGLKAMQELQTINPRKGTATNAMCTFLAINTSSVTLIPATAIGMLAAAGISEPTRIVPTAILATLCSTIVAIIAVKFFQRLPVFAVSDSDPKDAVTQEDESKDEEESEAALSPWTTGRKVAGGLLAVAILLVIGLEMIPSFRDSVQAATGLDDLIAEQAAEAAESNDADEAEAVEAASVWWRDLLDSIAVVAIPLVFLIFVGYAAVRGVKVFEEFVEGAKEGWSTAVRIMPFLVAMLVAMGMFRDSGALYLIKLALSDILSAVQFPPDLLPMALMRPLSGGGSMGIMGDILANDGLSESLKLTAATMFGSTETTFYVLAVYFGSIGVRRTRHALAAGLCADAAGVIAAIVICRFYFGA